jgi:hypothetical protein
MATVKILWAHPERKLFNQIAMFSVVGFAASLALTFACNLQISAQWL